MRNIVILYICLSWLTTTSFVTGYQWAQAWADGELKKVSDIPKKSYQATKAKNLELVLLSKDNMITTHENGNSYLQCYIVNNTDLVMDVNRADATIYNVSSEIYKDGKWMSFQLAYPVACGDSFWVQKLNPKQVLAMRYDHNETGDITVPFRLKYQSDGIVIYSNQIEINIDQINHKRVKN